MKRTRFTRRAEHRSASRGKWIDVDSRDVSEGRSSLQLGEVNQSPSSPWRAVLPGFSTRCGETMHRVTRRISACLDRYCQKRVDSDVNV